MDRYFLTEALKIELYRSELRSAGPSDPMGKYLPLPRKERQDRIITVEDEDIYIIARIGIYLSADHFLTYLADDGVDQVYDPYAYYRDFEQRRATYERHDWYPWSLFKELRGFEQEFENPDVVSMNEDMQREFDLYLKRAWDDHYTHLNETIAEHNRNHPEHKPLDALGKPPMPGISDEGYPLTLFQRPYSKSLALNWVNEQEQEKIAKRLEELADISANNPLAQGIWLFNECAANVLEAWFVRNGMTQEYKDEREGPQAIIDELADTAYANKNPSREDLKKYEQNIKRVGNFSTMVGRWALKRDIKDVRGTAMSWWRGTPPLR